MNRTPTLRLLLLPACLLALATGSGPVTPLVAQSQTETKIRLMSDALRARDAGDLATAQRLLTELQAVAPGDPTVRRLLDGVNQALAAQAQGLAVPYGAPEPVAVPATPPPSRRILGPRSTEPALPSVVAGEVEALARAEDARIEQLMDAARAARREARSLVRNRRFDDAVATLEAAIASLPANPRTSGLIADLQEEKAGALLAKSRLLVREGDTSGARSALEGARQIEPDSRSVRFIAGRISSAELKPPTPSIEQANPRFLPERAAIAAQIAKGRSQYLAGDLDGAADTFRKVEAQDPDNAEAKTFLTRIAEQRASVGVLNREKTRASMLQEVAQSWQRPGIFEERAQDAAGGAGLSPLAAKLNAIVIPSVNFSGVDLARVVSTLSAVSEEYDQAGAAPRGVNIVLIDPTNANPAVNITLRNLTLKRILDFITDAVGYQYDVQADAVVVRPGGERSLLDTAFFPVSRATVLRMTGAGQGGGSAPAAPANDPFAPSPAMAAGPAPTGESAGLRAFLQQAGVNFDGVPGSSLVYDGSAMIVTQTTRNIERIRNILNRYNDVRQVEIEAKFMEVREGALEELGVQWEATRRGGREVYSSEGVLRPLASAFTNDNTGVGPVLPGVPNVGIGAGALGIISGSIGEFGVDALVRALSQKQGSDLLSAPKVTVLSGNQATIRIAQELRYATRYTEPEFTPPTERANGTIIPGTFKPSVPEEFESRDVGVRLNVTPTVEEDNYSITLDLNPVITEFEGFIDYGSAGQNGDTTILFQALQPIFSERTVTTRVTVWDGATVVMGGLQREETKRVSDKVPVLGNLPVVGRLFRSQGESSEKRNLLIFVTANLVSPGGSLKNQPLRNVQPNSLYQNPTFVTPSGSEPRAVRGGN